MSEQSGGVSPREGEATGREFKGILSTTEERVSEILVATERAATEIVDAANLEAEQLIRAAHARAESLAQSRVERIDSVTEAVLAKAGALEGEIDGLRDLINRSIETLAEELAIGPRSPEPAPPAADEPSPWPAETTLSNGMRASARRDRSEAVKLLATQMLAAGHTRDETERRLKEEFGVKDPTATMNAIGSDAVNQS